MAIPCPECARLTWPNLGVNCPAGMAVALSAGNCIMMMRCYQLIKKSERQCKSIPDLPILLFLQNLPTEAKPNQSGMNRGIHESCSIRHAFPAWAYELSGKPTGRLVLAKMERLIQRKLISGCPCGCIGSFQITLRGYRELKFFQCTAAMRNEIVEMFGTEHKDLINNRIDEQVQRFMTGKDIPQQHWSWFKFTEDIIEDWKQGVHWDVQPIQIGSWGVLRNSDPA